MRLSNAPRISKFNVPMKFLPGETIAKSIMAYIDSNMARAHNWGRALSLTDKRSPEH